MKLKNPMLVVTDIDRSFEFYKKQWNPLQIIIIVFQLNKAKNKKTLNRAALILKGYYEKDAIPLCVPAKGW